VSDGEDDTADEFPFVVRLDSITTPATNSGRCSGVLVTPALVLSAKHCFGDPIDFPFECFGTLFPVGSFRNTSNVSGSIVLASGTTTFTHTNDRNPNSTTDALQPIMAPNGNPVQFCTDSGSSHDVALFRLDQRVPTTLVRPLHPPILNGGPPSPSCRAGLDDSDLTLVMPFEAQAWTAIDTGAAAFRAVARRDLVLWRSYQATRHVMRGYTSAGGTKNYWTPPDGFSVKSVALSDTTLAWVVASGPDVDHSTWPYTTAKLYWAPYTTDPAALAPRESVELPKADLIYLKTGGGFAVTRAGILSDVDAEPKGVYPLVVVELASGRSWQIFPAKNRYFIAEVMAISKDLLFVGRGDSSKNDPQSLHELVVFDLSQLDAIAQSSAPN
jgi:hypothetical protein